MVAVTDHYAVVNAEDIQPRPVQTKPPFVCEICSRTFKTQSALGVHFRTHGSAKEPCPECGQEFFPGPGMSRHRQAYHGAAKLNGEPPKKGGNEGAQPPPSKRICPECHKPISSKDLMRHRRRVHGYTDGATTTSTSKTVALPDDDDGLNVDEIFDAVVGMLFPRGVVPITALVPLLRWRHATDELLIEVHRG